MAVPLRTLRIALAVAYASFVTVPLLVAQPPRAVQPGWEIELFAESPQIVTPVGIAMHPEAGVLVIESHTHSPPSGYEGLPSDQVVRLVDEDGDGFADRRETFADGFEDAMNLIVDAEGIVYLVQRDRVIRLEDDDGDGYANRVEELLRLETEASYDHSGLLGIAFDGAGGLLVTRGNSGGFPYALIASDSSRIDGFGEGGEIVALTKGGEQLKPFATGFWNPFGLRTDSAGLLWCVDNDPDAVGPNRLVHVIEGGDYGYRAAYGSSGRWPLSAWNGELPGTLPYAAGTGEAPGGIAVLEQGEWAGEDLLVTSWGEHRIDCFRLMRNGSRLAAARTTVIEGGEDFRPVAIAAAGEHEFYVTDWVLKEYPNHGRGRIWRLRYRPGRGADVTADKRIPRDTLRRYGEAIAAYRRPDALTDETTALLTNAFVFSNVVDGLATLDRAALAERFEKATDPLVRAAAVLASAEGSGDEEAAPLWKSGLEDTDRTVRLAALRAAALRGEPDDREALRRVLAAGPVDAQLVRVFLAADEALSHEARQREARRIRGMTVERRFDAETVATLLREENVPAASLAELIAIAEGELPDDAARYARGFLSHDDLQVRREAVWTLARSEPARAAADLQSIVDSEDEPSVLRADALALAAPQFDGTRIVGYLRDDAEAVVYEALRALRGREDATLATQVYGEVDRLKKMSRPLAWIEEVYPELLEKERKPRPRSLSEWMAAVAEEGDREAGRRVFFSDAAQCSNCHRVGGRGGIIGPELTEMQKGHDRESMLTSIYDPAQEIAPEFQTHALVTRNGELITGIQFHYRGGGTAISIIPQDGVERRFPIEELEAYGPSPKSLMPEGLLERLTVAEVRDLLAFLMK